MTFIATVVAKKGLAVIADSLVTSMKMIIEYDRLIDYLAQKSTENPDSPVSLTANDLATLLQLKPSHTKDFEEKLFMYDKYTAVTTAGGAVINGKRIEYLIKDAIKANRKDSGYKNKRISTKVNDFCDFLRKEVKEHVSKSPNIGKTTFIFSNYSKTTEITTIYKVQVWECDAEQLKNAAFDPISSSKMEDFKKVVCDGQSRTSDRIIFGETDFFFEIVPKIIDKVINDLKISETNIPENYKVNFFSEAKSILPKSFFDDMKFSRMADLSLQQAVELASLLMKIEINLQKYTENIPTVGGVIKLAVVDADGFRFISGNEIHKPENLN